MPDTVTLTARLVPGPDSPPLRSSRCVLRAVPGPFRSNWWNGAVLVSCGEREAILMVSVYRARRGWVLETWLDDPEDPNKLCVSLPAVSGAVPMFTTEPWHFLNTDFGVRLVVEAEVKSPDEKLS